MRYREINQPNHNNSELEEVAMNPRALKAFSSGAGAKGMQAGFEAELVFSGLGEAEDSEPDWQPDYDQDRRPRSIEDVIDFFNDSDWGGLSERQELRIREAIDEEYIDWISDQMMQEWERDQDDYVKEYLERNADLEGDELEQRVTAALADQNGDYDAALDDYRDNWEDSGDMGEFFRQSSYPYMQDVEDAFSLSWPYMTDNNEGTGGGEGGFNEQNAQRLADDLESELGVKTTVSSGYHSAKRDATTWIFEPDSSLDADESDDMPVEIVSPPMPLGQALEILPKFFEWATSNGAYANKSTGFHMSVSMGDHENNVLDYTKLALFLGDEYVLEQFGRAANTYAQSAIGKIRNAAGKTLKEDDTAADSVLKNMRASLNQFATRALATPSGFGKYTSINPKTNYIEFRSAGGTNYFEDIDKIKNTLMRYARAMDIAMDPAAEKQEYAKKLYKLLTKTETQQVTDPTTGTKRTIVKPSNDADAIAIFSRYVAGELPKSALKSFIKQIQHGRDVERNKLKPNNGETSPTGHWEIYKRTSDTTLGTPFEAANREAATSELVTRFQSFYGQDWRDHVARYDVRPTALTTAGETRQYEIYDRVLDQAIQGFRADSSEEAVRRFQQYQETHPNTDTQLRYANTETPVSTSSVPAADDPAGNYVLRRRQGNEGVGPVLYRFSADTDMGSIQAARQWADARGIERSSVWLDRVASLAPEELQAPPAPQQAQAAAPGNTFTGEWAIRTARTGEELYRFGGIGNSQGDANRVALRWLGQNGYGSGTEVDVVPIMAESRLFTRVFNEFDNYFESVIDLISKRLY